jgi:hypothetical protein
MTTPTNWTNFIQQIETTHSRNLRLIDMKTYQPPNNPQQFIDILRQNYNDQTIINITD